MFYLYQSLFRSYTVNGPVDPATIAQYARLIPYLMVAVLLMLAFTMIPYGSTAAKLFRGEPILLKLRRSMIYPAVVLLAVTAASLTFSIRVLPQMAELYTKMGVTLPWVARASLFVSEPMRQFPVTTGMLFAGYAVALLLWVYAPQRRETR